MRTPLNVYIKKEYQGFAAITKFLAAIVQERPLFKKYFFNPKFAAIIQERPLFESNRYWRGYGRYEPLLQLSYSIYSMDFKRLH